MSSKKDISQKKTIRSEIKSVPSQTREAKSEKYSSPRSIPTFKDRPKPKSIPAVPPSPPSKKD